MYYGIIFQVPWLANTHYSLIWKKLNTIYLSYINSQHINVCANLISDNPKSLKSKFKI